MGEEISMSGLIIAAVKAHSFMIQRRYCYSTNYANSYPALAIKKSPQFHLLSHAVDG
jgi:hypothetical protein